jgi:hypothetical protein
MTVAPPVTPRTAPHFSTRRRSTRQRTNKLQGTLSSSANHAAADESLGARQSPRGDNDPPELTFGPFGMAERLNWLVSKKRFKNTPSQRLISPMLYDTCFSAGTFGGQAPRFASFQA